MSDTQVDSGDVEVAVAMPQFTPSVRAMTLDCGTICASRYVSGGTKLALQEAQEKNTDIQCAEIGRALQAGIYEIKKWQLEEKKKPVEKQNAHLLGIAFMTDTEFDAHVAMKGVVSNNVGAPTRIAPTSQDGPGVRHRNASGENAKTIKAKVAPTQNSKAIKHRNASGDVPRQINNHVAPTASRQVKHRNASGDNTPQLKTKIAPVK